MESEVSEDRPLSPKKKLRPSSTTNSDMPELESGKHDNLVDGSNKSGIADSVSSHLVGNGLAPTRTGRDISSSSSSCSDISSVSDRKNIPSTSQSSTASAQNNTLSIQEEEVSSSESSVVVKAETASYAEGDADSLTNGEAEGTSSNNREAAEKKEL